LCLRKSEASGRLGNAAPASVYDRCHLVVCLAQLGRFAEAVEHEADARQFAEPTRHGYPVALVHWAAGTLHPLRGDWAKARSLIDRWIVWIRPRDVFRMLAYAVASSAWVRAQLGASPTATLGLGKLARRTGKHVQARDHLTAASAMYREMDMPFWLKQPEAEIRELE